MLLSAVRAALLTKTNLAIQFENLILTHNDLKE